MLSITKGHPGVAATPRPSAFNAPGVVPATHVPAAPAQPMSTESVTPRTEPTQTLPAATPHTAPTQSAITPAKITPPPPPHDKPKDKNKDHKHRHDNDDK